MAVPASSPIPSSSYPRAKSELHHLDSYLGDVVASMAAGTFSGSDVFTLLSRLNSADAAVEIAEGTVGIVQYAKDQEGNPLLDILAEYATVRAAILTAITNIDTSIPSDGNGYLLLAKLSKPGGIPDGTLEWRTFTSGQTSSLQTDITAIRSAIT